MWRTPFNSTYHYKIFPAMENEIGRIGRRVCAYNYTTKSIMADFRVLAECSVLVENIMNKPGTSEQVVRCARNVLGLTNTIFYSKTSSGCCKLVGRPEENTKMIRRFVEAIGVEIGQDWTSKDIYTFNKAVIENGIQVRTHKHNEKYCRNESIVMDSSGTVIAVKHVVAAVDVEAEKVCGTFVFGEALTRTHTNISGNSSVKVNHIFKLERSRDLVLINTADITKHLVILEEQDNLFTVSPPSNIFRVT
ncbi:hypothetical protein RvY_00128-1 [Ramazzottius varieornatus]|uniref:Uncharacterized protein n=1 Tax=Ramazzottius varieornatus TaxID=947166 RepID=A0A1D1UC50_RAMVA|nr:hypothetical protein RvY_00128-1 [Ramazzottius varieornatus]